MFPTYPEGGRYVVPVSGCMCLDRVVDSEGVHCVVVIDVLHAGISRLGGMTLSAIYPGILSCGIVLSWRAGDGFHR